MENGININPINFKGYSYAQNAVTNPIDNKPREFSSDFYVDKNGAEAIKVKNFVANPIEINKPISLDDYTNQLNRAGLVEGKDYDVQHYDNAAAIFITKGNEFPYKIAYWRGGTEAGHFDGYNNISYPITGDIKAVDKYYNKDGILETECYEYKNPDAHKDLFPENIDINTKPEDYVKTLKQKGINFEINKEKHNNATWADITEYGNDGNVSKITFFSEDDDFKAVTQENTPDGNGNLVRSVHIFKDKDSEHYDLNVTNYVKDKGIRNNIKY